MAEIKPEAVLNGVTLALKVYFPDSHIYTEATDQPPEGGDFSVSVGGFSVKALNKTLAKYDVDLSVIYFPKNNSHEDCVQALAPIQRALSLITLPSGETLRGYEVSTGITEGVVQCGARYSYMLKILFEEEKMEKVNVHGKTEEKH